MKITYLKFCCLCVPTRASARSGRHACGMCPRPGRAPHACTRPVPAHTAHALRVRTAVLTAARPGSGAEARVPGGVPVGPLLILAVLVCRLGVRLFSWSAAGLGPVRGCQE